MTDQTTASLIAEAREAAKRADWYMTGESPLLRALADALEAAEQERDNWRLSAEEAFRAEKRWKDRAVEAERLAEVRRETIREYERENEAWSVRAHTAERERNRLDEAFDRDLPWRYDEVEAQRNQLAAVVEKAEDFVTRHYLDTRFGDEVLPILASAGADVLREYDAALIEGLADEIRHKQHAESIRQMLREKARERREEKP